MGLPVNPVSDCEYDSTKGEMRTIGGEGSLLDGLREGGVRVAGARNVLARRAVLDGQSGLADQLASSLQSTVSEAGSTTDCGSTSSGDVQGR